MRVFRIHVRITFRKNREPFLSVFFSSSFISILSPHHHQPLHLKKRKNNPNAQQKWLYYTQYLYWCVCITVVCVSGLQTTQEKWHVTTWIAQVEECLFFFSPSFIIKCIYVVQWVWRNVGSNFFIKIRGDFSVPFRSGWVFFLYYFNGS